jgi:hypothetical protein
VSDRQQQQERCQLETGRVDHVRRKTAGHGDGRQRLERLDRERDREGESRNDYQQAGADEDGPRIESVHEDQRGRERNEDAEVGDRAGGIPERRAERSAGYRLRIGRRDAHPGSSIVTFVALTAATACMPVRRPI